jgi:hypothetical protein
VWADRYDRQLIDIFAIGQVIGAHRHRQQSRDHLARPGETSGPKTGRLQCVLAGRFCTTSSQDANERCVCSIAQSLDSKYAHAQRGGVRARPATVSGCAWTW